MTTPSSFQTELEFHDEFTFLLVWAGSKNIFFHYQLRCNIHLDYRQMKTSHLFFKQLYKIYLVDI